MRESRSTFLSSCKTFTKIVRMWIFEYTYKWWRGNCKNSPLPTIGSVFQCVKVDLPFCIDVCTCVYILKWYSALFFFFFWKRLIHLLLRTETTAQGYLWLNRRAAVKGIQTASPSFICIFKDVNGAIRWWTFPTDSAMARCKVWGTSSGISNRTACHAVLVWKR